jgi:phosphatidylserine/phosphatidylglycerophosphate/cardiolipin synthase-like enzyme
MILNRKAEAVKEELAVGLRQAENLGRLRQVAAETGHALGCYTVVAKDRDGRALAPRPDQEETGIYIHSKLVIVDDSFITVGSANLTNRSMGVDTELHASWEVEEVEVDVGHPQSARLGRAIRRARVSLLAEHLGFAGAAAVRPLARVEGLVQHLDNLIATGQGSLRQHPSPTDDEQKIIGTIDPQALPFDPAQAGEDPAAEEEAQRTVFRGGIAQLWRRLTSS